MDMEKVNISTITSSKIKEIDEFLPSIFCRLLSLRSDEKGDQDAPSLDTTSLSSLSKKSSTTFSIDEESVEIIEFPELGKQEKTEGGKVHSYPPEVALKMVSSGLNHFVFVFR